MKENLGRLYPVPPNPPEKCSFPVVDQVIVLDLEFDKLLERVAQMKQDPTTGTVYDPVVNPIPETDKKLVARLEPVKADEEQLRALCSEFAENKSQLENFFARFGFAELDSSVFQLLDASQPPATIEGSVLAMIKRILTFKYSLYEADQLPLHYKQLIPEEISAENMPDVSEKNESVKPDTKLEIRSQHLGIPGDAAGARRPSVKDLTGSYMSPPGLSQSKVGKNASYYSGSKAGSYKKLDTMSQRSGATKKEKLLIHSLDAWEKLFTDYTENLEKNMRETKDMFQVIRLHFENSQKVFASIFRERREFHSPLTSFADGYRRFSADNPEVVKGEYCKQKLYEKIDSIHDQLWEELEKCRAKATKEKDKMVTKHLINADIQAMCKIALSLVAGEMNKLFNLK